MKTRRNRWMQRHITDPYVQQAQVEGYRSRAAYKLIEINNKDKLLQSGMTVVDLGAAPGGWTQVVIDHIGESGQVFALDLLPMDSFPNVKFIQGDFSEESVLNQLVSALGDRKVDLVISDMAPNMSGVRSVDQPRSIYLAELALDFAEKTLKPGGDLLVKTFEGEGIAPLRAAFQKAFSKVLNRKPKASRDESRETYLLGKGLIY